MPCIVMWRKQHFRNTIVMLLISIVLVCGTGVYEIRYSLWNIPYDWSEIRSVGCLRVSSIKDDTVFVGQVIRFAKSKNLEIDINYCSNIDELWLNLVAYKTDLVHFPNDNNEYSWTTRHNSHQLKDSVDFWYDRNIRSISKWDCYFRQYGDSIGWDWKMLAAIGYVESRFKNINSSTGLGVMQISRTIATKFGAIGSMYQNPHYNIKAAANYIKYLDNTFSMIQDREERTKFVLAAYNAGTKPVKNAINTAKQHKINECEWDNVAKYFRNNHSKRYQKLILEKYNEYRIKE